MKDFKFLVWNFICKEGKVSLESLKIGQYLNSSRFEWKGDECLSNLHQIQVYQISRLWSSQLKLQFKRGLKLMWHPEAASVGFQWKFCHGRVIWDPSRCHSSIVNLVIYSNPQIESSRLEWNWVKDLCNWKGFCFGVNSIFVKQRGSY